MEPKLFVALCVLIVGLPLLATELTSRYWRKRHQSAVSVLERKLDRSQEMLSAARAIQLNAMERLIVVHSEAMKLEEENAKLREASK